MRTVRAYLLKEDFQQFWECRSPTEANRFLRRWCRQAARSRLAPAGRVARTLLKHRPLLLNWFRTGRVHSSGAVEGLNGKAKLALRKAYGFKWVVLANRCRLKWVVLAGAGPRVSGPPQPAVAGSRQECTDPPAEEVYPRSPV